MSFLRASLMSMLTAGVLSAAENTVVLNIEPAKENPRNSEGSFATLKSGRILFYYTQFYGGAADNSPARIVCVHSDDRGRTWCAPHTVIENASGENVMSVSLLRLKSGKLALFYCVKNSLHDCRACICISTDEGETWSEPKLVVPAPGYFVLNNDRVIQLNSGRLVVPVAFHRSRHSDPKDWKSFDGRGIALWYLSDDEGQTWTEAATWWAAPAHSSAGLQEPGVVELADGSLFSWARTTLGAQYGFTSADRGKTWSAPEPTSLKSPCSPASIKRLPNSPELLAVFNDHSGAFEFPKGKRTPLVSAVSSDGGKTWSRHKLIESDPDGWYCYTAIHFTDDAVLLAYCAGDKKVGGLNRLRIRRISLDWLKTGQP
ncbi:MAG: sialidase family protein [Verrucomicrobia bacterium]|nr:sialidase family protein [Verrucomicrobiota bacterium]